MNNNLLEIVKKLVAEQGVSILSEPKRVSAFFSDLAQDVPKPQKNAFVKCLELKSAQILQNAGEEGRADCKQQLARNLHDEEGLARDLCEETLDLLDMVIFGEIQKKISCNKCGKELQKDWKTCPYCATTEPKPAPKPKPVAQTPSPKQSPEPAAKTPPPKPKPAPTTQTTSKPIAKCISCHYCNNGAMVCSYYGLPLVDAFNKCNIDVSKSTSPETKPVTQTSQPSTPKPSPQQQTGSEASGGGTIKGILGVIVFIIAVFNPFGLRDIIINFIMSLF